TRISGSWPSPAASSSSFWESWRTSSTSTGMYLPSSYLAALTSSSSLMTGIEMYRTNTKRPLTALTTRLVLKSFLEKSSLMVSGMETWGETSAIPNSVTLYWPLISVTWTALMNFDPTSIPTRFREAMISEVYHPLGGCQVMPGKPPGAAMLFDDPGRKAQRDGGLRGIVLELLLRVARKLEFEVL